MKSSAADLQTVICAQYGSLINQKWPHCGNLARTHALDKSSPDFWSLGVQSDGHWFVVYSARPKALSCITDILDRLSMVLYNVEC